MANLEFVTKKIREMLDKSREDKNEYKAEVEEILMEMGTTQEEVDSSWTKALVVKRLAETNSEKEVKELLTFYTKMSQERRKITTLNRILSLLTD